MGGVWRRAEWRGHVVWGRGAGRRGPRTCSHKGWRGGYSAIERGHPVGEAGLSRSRAPGPGEGLIQEKKGRRVPCSAGRGRGTRRADTTGTPGPKPPVSLAAAVWRHWVSWNQCPFGSRVPQSSKV